MSSGWAKEAASHVAHASWTGLSLRNPLRAHISSKECVLSRAAGTIQACLGERQPAPDSRLDPARCPSCMHEAYALATSEKVLRPASSDWPGMGCEAVVLCSGCCRVPGREVVAVLVVAVVARASVDLWPPAVSTCASGHRRGALTPTRSPDTHEKP